MVYDLVIDTHVLQYVIKNYDSKNEFNLISFEIFELSEKVKNEINLKIHGKGDSGFVVASAMAFVEIANKFDSDFKQLFNFEKFKAFVKQPPQWFLIEPISIECASQLYSIESIVYLNDIPKPIELSDAIHAATVLVRDEIHCQFATLDTRLHKVRVLKNRIIE